MGHAQTLLGLDAKGHLDGRAPLYIEMLIRLFRNVASKHMSEVCPFQSTLPVGFKGCQRQKQATHLVPLRHSLASFGGSGLARARCTSKKASRWRVTRSAWIRTIACPEMTASKEPSWCKSIPNRNLCRDIICPNNIGLGNPHFTNWVFLKRCAPFWLCFSATPTGN